MVRLRRQMVALNPALPAIGMNCAAKLREEAGARAWVVPNHVLPGASQHMSGCVN